MQNLKKINALSSFFMNKKDEEVQELFKDVHNRIRQTLNLPDNIKVTGITFDYVDISEAADATSLDCDNICTKIIDGQLHYFCCEE